jgi:hypothetical protein
MNKQLCSRLVLTVAIVIISVMGAEAQDVANGQAIANVLATLTVTATQNLDFGNIYQGVAKIQDETDDALSGIFTITGASGAGLSVYMQLPEYLALASGADRLTIAFGAQDCTFSVLDAAAPSTPSFPGAGALLNQDPRMLAGTTVGAASGTSQVFIGGKVIPAVNQSAGAYAGDVVCTVAYTGT